MATGKRELIDTGTDKRYVRRDDKGRFEDVVDVGKSLSQDRKRQAKHEAKPGQGDRGDALTGQAPRGDATRLHYDLRLELDGVLKSWAVARPKPRTWREAAFRPHRRPPAGTPHLRGRDPKGEYGGGTMIVWDQGRWRPEGD